MTSVFVEPKGWENPPKDVTRTTYQCNCCTYYTYNEDEMKSHCLCYTIEQPQDRKCAV